MTLTSIDFFFFLIGAFVLFYLSGKRFQKYVLLGASLFFYLQVVSISAFKVILILAYVILVTWLGALIIDSCKGRLRTVAVFLVVSALVAALFVLKYAYNMVSMLFALFSVGGNVEWLQFAAVMGISYFTLSAIGYLMDVYWGTYKAEKNIGMIALFILYFPQLVSGPITRFPQMKEQFEAHHKPEYSNVAYGMRRMIWGYFKKLIISERFALVVTAVYDNPTGQSGIWLLFATICYVIRLYTDFSGCMDIVLGASQLFGIVLPENFNAPFLSLTFKEFWQRWHITLGNWFKDYVMYPIQISKPMVNLGKKLKKRFGKNIGKRVPVYVAMLALWLLLGIWHGATAHYFVATGIIPYLLLVGGDWFQPKFENITKRLKINIESFGFRLFQRLRTILVICIGWVFICTEDVAEGFLVWKRILLRPWMSGAPGITALLHELTSVDAVLMIFGVLLLIAEHYFVSRESSLTQVLDKQRAVVRGAVLYAELLLILFCGMVGSSSFIYFNF